MGVLVLAACATPGASQPARVLAVNQPPQSAEAPTVKASHPPTLIQHGTVMTAAGQVFENGHLLLVDGRIADVGQAMAPRPRAPSSSTPRRASSPRG